ncbi:MAG TPA: hypothetical protein DCZ43_11360, partial [candidate division Zixibacteria bacterium]|nr:hypothetical protein [candidate division Zixibacteria bacterium]
IRTAFENGDVDFTWLQSSPRHAGWDYSVTEGWTFHNDTWLTVAGAYDYEINGGILVSTVMAEAGDNQIGSIGYEKAYLVYMDNSAFDTDVLFSRIVSYFDVTEFVDFSPRIRLSDDELGNGADQFMPTVAVDELGTVHVAFFDRRNDPNNLLYDVYYTSSSDLGYTWSPNVRVTTASSDPSQPGVAGQIGNRIGIAAWEGHVYITWTDCRNGNTDVYASRMLETGISEQPAPLPENISLDNLYPNPFNSSVEIRYSANSVQHVSLDVIDLLGRQITNLFDGNCQAGSNRIIWDGKSGDGQDVSSGIYFVRLAASGRSQIKKAVLLR